MAGDPAIRWLTMRDLLAAPPAAWKPERAEVAQRGWGARILAHQDSSGRWTPRIYGKKWISTTYSLALLRRFGLPPRDSRAVRSCGLLLDEGLWHDGGINVSAGLKRSETCVTGMVLGVVAWFCAHDPRHEDLVGYLLREQMDDGGWNCERYRGATHSSFHTTVNVLEGLREYVGAGGPRAYEVAQAEARAREFFLMHRLYRSHRTGEIVHPAFTRFSFPPRWHHDVLRALDYFQASGASYDERLEDPLELVRKRRGKDGCWVLQNRHPGQTFFELEQVGEPSRWNTLRALRVLLWWDRAKRSAQ
jgi:hypothetical protein